MSNNTGRQTQVIRIYLLTLSIVTFLLFGSCSKSVEPPASDDLIEIGSSLFDFFDPIKLEESQTLMIEGYLTRSASPYPPFIMFVGLNDSNEVMNRYVNLIGFPSEDDLGHNVIVRVTGIVLETNDGIGDMEVNEVEHIRSIDGFTETVDEHWSNLSQRLLEETNSTEVDGGYSYPLFNQGTQEIILSHNVGEMRPSIFGDLYYVSTVRVFYFLDMDGEITRILLVYPENDVT